MTTFFSVAKPFRGHIDLIQRNAILSWLSAVPNSEVVIFGDEFGTAEVCQELGVLHGGSIRRSEFGRSLVSDAFGRIRQIGQHEVLAFVNCDIVLLDDFQNAINVLRRANMNPYLMSSRRYHYDVFEALMISDINVRRKLRDDVLTGGTLDGPAAMDCFLFPRSMRFAMPLFAVGEVAWDNWMIQNARDVGVPVVDATPDCVLIHQRHQALSAGPTSPDGRRNVRLAGGLGRLGTLREADWIIQEGRLIRPSAIRRVYTLVHDLPPARGLLHLKRAARRIVWSALS